MASTKDLKKRIVTVKNTQQTTRAMKMVSAAKLRRAQEAIVNQRPYALRIAAMIGRLIGVAEKEEHSAFLNRLDETPQKLLLVLVSSDRGLCGGFNSSVIKSATRWIAENEKKYEKIDLAFVGKKARDFFKFNAKPGIHFQEFGSRVQYNDAKSFSDFLIEKFLSGEYSQVKVVYNEFKNAVLQEVQVEDFLPVVPEQFTETSIDQYLFRPEPVEMLDLLLKKNFAIQMHRIFLESQASEHGARMAAMENATKNAGEMIRSLNLQYNKQRQAGITKELLEIIAGSESQKVK